MPIPVSKLNGMIGYMLGIDTEYINPDKAVAEAKGREGRPLVDAVTRVKSMGYIKVKFNVIVQNMEALGYDVGK